MDLKINQDYYTHASFIAELQKRQVKNFSVLYYYVNLEIYETNEEVLSIFTYRKDIIENYGEIDKISIFLANKDDDLDNDLDDEKIIVYSYLDKINSIVIIYTLANSDEIDGILNRRFKRAFGTYYIPINFTAFMKLTSYLTRNHPSLIIPFFVTVHYPTFKTEGIHRKETRRTINYWGEDGLDTMKELKKYYGMLPKVIEYKIENYGTFLITNKNLSLLIRFL